MPTAMRVLSLRLVFILWLLLAGHLAEIVSDEPVYCIDGERSQLQQLTEASYDISMYPIEITDRRLARKCLWVIEVPQDRNGGLLLQMRHRDRPVHVGTDSIANLTVTLYRNGSRTKEFQWNQTTFKYIGMNSNDRLELRFTVDNASAMRADNSLYLFASFATNQSCSDGSQLHYNAACYLVYRHNSSDAVFNSLQAVPIELAAGATFETVSELLGFIKMAPGLLKMDRKQLLIPGMKFCNGTLSRLIRIDAGADGGARCQWYPMEGNISIVQWATGGMTHSSCCNSLVLEQSTEQPPSAVLRCVTSEDAASQLPALLAVPSSQRRVARQPAPPHNDNSVDCGSFPRSHGTVPPDRENSDKAKHVLPWAVAGVLAFLVAALVIGLVYYCHCRRVESPGSTHTASNGGVSGNHKMAWEVQPMAPGPMV